jgi:hypothetical protein
MQNTYRPFFLRESFDIVVGNPPWLTFSDVDNGQYQRDLEQLAGLYNIKPGPAYMSQLDLAAIFLAHACNYFLNAKGRMAFIQPRAFFSGGQHHSTRTGKAKHVEIAGIWDLRDIDPLFKVPACVLFAKRQLKNGALASKKIKGKEFKGRLHSTNLDKKAADKYITIKDGSFYLSKLGESTAWTFGKAFKLVGNSPYKDEFKNGATIFPRCFYFIDINQMYDGSLRNRMLQIKSSSVARREAKRPWNDIVLRGEVESKFIYRTALANNILPFALNGTRLVVLPCLSDANRLKLLTNTQMENAGEIELLQWFSLVESEWNKKRTERNANTAYVEYLNWMNKLTDQDISLRYCVLYVAAGTNICATIVDREMINDFNFIAEHKTYVYSVNDLAHAGYLVAFLNANSPNEYIKPFQSQGLQGARDIHKKILDVPFPLFSRNNPLHQALSFAGLTATNKAKTFIATKNFGDDGNTLGPRELGKLRGEVRAHLANELAEIDALLEQIIPKK